jgi:membrane protease YdiL (CAAX protease family)
VDVAFKSSRKVYSRPGSIPAFSDFELERIWYGTILNLSMMFVLAWAVGNGFGYRVFVLPTLNVQVVLAAISALWLCLLIRFVARQTRSVSERQKMVVFALAPRTRRQWFLKSVVVLCASVAEEPAYRGVGWEILSYSINHHWLAALVCCLAFALAHRMQGWISMLMILLIAGIMHGLVWYTKSLVSAMIVHGAFDFVAITLIAVEASQQRKSRSTTGTGKIDHE